MEERWGFWVNFWKGELLFEIVKFLSLVRCGLAGSPMNQFSAELNGRREFQMKRESFIRLVVLLVIFSCCSVLDTVLETKVLAINV